MDGIAMWVIKSQTTRAFRFRYHRTLILLIEVTTGVGSVSGAIKKQMVAAKQFQSRNMRI